MVFLTILKYICLAVAIAYTFSNVGKLFRSMRISSFQMWAMSLGIVGYLALEFAVGA